MHMEKTNQPTMQSPKGQARTRTEKTRQEITITQGRKDHAQPGSLRGWDRVPRRARAPLERQQDQGGIKYGPFFLTVRQAG
ncbi:hypothetical protein SAMN05216387_1089 [Nitrosovibrio tenuis]|uniref:Uncharacterized protein n=1 Tax=Nitrosovibrio tenuis TaxID=1233 RepID=A0A1H7P1E6_9PROT|nr:hypothetical protein SAMN05216387_1089 [Nitrosovibrio tenuis]